jgi:hypothetical protein
MRYESTILRPTTKDLTNQSFDRLTVLAFAGYAFPRRPYWTCQCTCGAIKDILAGNLMKGLIRSCTCLRRETTRQHRTTHGKAHTPEYRVWHHILGRCENPADAGYSLYGGRGITVCEQWHDFATFYQDMGPRPSPQHSIERRDNDGPYSPENTYWATATEQNRNKRNNHLLTLFGVTKCLGEWATITRLGRTTILYRRKNKWSDERALTTPSRTVPVIVFPPGLFTAQFSNSLTQPPG